MHMTAAAIPIPYHIPRCDNAAPRVARRAMHQLWVGGIDANCKRREGVGDKVDPEDHRHQERQYQRLARARDHPEQARRRYAQEHHQYLAEIGRHKVAQELLDVGVDGSTLFDRCDDRGEVVVALGYPWRVRYLRRLRPKRERDRARRPRVE